MFSLNAGHPKYDRSAQGKQADPAASNEPSFLQRVGVVVVEGGLTSVIGEFLTKLFLFSEVSKQEHQETTSLLVINESQIQTISAEFSGDLS